MSAFAVLVPGRAVDTSFQQVVPFPPESACCIYFSLPDPNAPPTWNYLGYLTSDKPSAIYKISNLTKPQPQDVYAQPQQVSGFNYVQAPVLHVAQIGISVVPRETATQMVPAVETPASNVSNFAEFINKTVSNLFNYCSSFSRPASELINNPFVAGLKPASTDSTQFVPLSSIQTWYENYTRRMSNDQNFWKSLN